MCKHARTHIHGQSERYKYLYTQKQRKHRYMNLCTNNATFKHSHRQHKLAHARTKIRFRNTHNQKHTNTHTCTHIYKNILINWLSCKSIHTSSYKKKHTHTHMNAQTDRHTYINIYNTQRYTDIHTQQQT